jgi:hypothetical protein
VNSIKWDEIVKIEPRLESLRQEAAAWREKDLPDDFCANEVWYEAFKPRIVRLVGWEAKDERLSGNTTYDVAYKTVLDAMPDCKHAGRICP